MLVKENSLSASPDSTLKRIKEHHPRAIQYCASSEWDRPAERKQGINELYLFFFFEFGVGAAQRAHPQLKNAFNFARAAGAGIGFDL